MEWARPRAGLCMCTCMYDSPTPPEGVPLIVSAETWHLENYSNGQ